MSKALVEYFKQRRAASLELIKKLVEMESPTSAKSAVDRLGAFVAERMRELTGNVEILAQPVYGHHIKARIKNGTPQSKVLVLGHLDTVWKEGEIVKRPFRIEGSRAYGPGVFDMKASILLVLLVLEALRDRMIEVKNEVVILFNSDEEDGSYSSRALIEQEAVTSRHVLVLEPPLPGNRVKTARKGVGRFQVAVSGLAAHAGIDHDKGVNAIEELAHQIVALQAMTDYGKGTTVNVGVVSGGTVSNVVPAEARAEVDVRVTTLEEGAAVTERILGLRPVHPKAQIKVTGGINRPPLVRTPAIVQLYQKARALAAEIGFELGEGSTGGGSDGCFTAALGIPTLDGLGVDGAGAHAVSEYINLDDIPRKAALIARLLSEG
jgi:glutamate carboxypeptidase